VYYFHGGQGAVLIGETQIDLVPGDLIIMKGMKRHGSVMRDTCSRTSLRIEESYARPLLQLPGSVDLFRPFRELQNCTPEDKEVHVQNIITYIERHYMHDLSLDELAQNIHFSKYYIAKHNSRRIKYLFLQTVHTTYTLG
jgi:hypothetical protein